MYISQLLSCRSFYFVYFIFFIFMIITKQQQLLRLFLNNVINSVVETMLGAVLQRSVLNFSFCVHLE